MKKIISLAYIVFCKEFNRGSCPYNESHMGKYKDEPRPVRLEHICAKCFLKSKERTFHSENLGECPYKSSLWQQISIQAQGQKQIQPLGSGVADDITHANRNQKQNGSHTLDPIIPDKHDKPDSDVMICARNGGCTLVPIIPVHTCIYEENDNNYLCNLNPHELVERSKEIIQSGKNNSVLMAPTLLLIENGIYLSLLNY